MPHRVGGGEKNLKMKPTAVMRLARQRKEDLSSHKCEKIEAAAHYVTSVRAVTERREKRSDLECGRETGVWRITISCRPSLLSCKFMALR